MLEVGNIINKETSTYLLHCGFCEIVWNIVLVTQTYEVIKHYQFSEEIVCRCSLKRCSWKFWKFTVKNSVVDFLFECLCRLVVSQFIKKLTLAQLLLSETFQYFTNTSGQLFLNLKFHVVYFYIIYPANFIKFSQKHR